jgi:uncharacterized protein (TIGR03546 family)
MIGMVIGLVPKDSAVVWSLMALALLLPIPLLATTISAVICTCLGLFLDAWTDTLGFWLLTQPALDPVWSRVNTSWASAWLRLNNTVTVGSLAIAWAAAGPTYLTTAWIARRIDRVRISHTPVRDALIPSLATELDR